ncbi:MAG: AMP-binding protein, partial [Oscillospiraceae bacterium]
TGKELLEVYWAKGVKMVNAYGMTEIGPNNMCHPIGLMTIDDVREKWNSCGKPAPFNQIRFLDEEGNDVPQGERGELVFNGKLLFSGYWNNPEAAAEMLQNGWVHSGDMGYLDEDGFCYISGRKKNMFISGGENIFPQEIEDVIMTIPGIWEACVVGVPDHKWGEVGRVLIVADPTENVTREKILAKVKEEMSSIKVPKYVSFVDDVPKNAIGKRDLKEIAKLYGTAEN